MRRVILFRWLGVAVATGIVVLHTGLFASITFGAESAANFSHLHQYIAATEPGQGDGDEDSVQRCIATWTDLPSEVAPGTRWSFATGDPDPPSFSVSPSDCAFDATTPSNTPLTVPPNGKLPWQASVNNAELLVAPFNFDNGEITFLHFVDAGSTVQIEFYFQPNQNPTPEPVPLPSLGRIYLVALAGLFVIVVTWRLNSRKLRKQV